MTKPTIMPVGIIEQSTGDSATFTLTRPGDPNILKINSSVMVRNTHWDQNEIPSGAMVRGYVTELGPTTATFQVVETKMGPYVKGGEKVYHCGGGIVYHRHDEKELN